MVFGFIPKKKKQQLPMGTDVLDIYRVGGVLYGCRVIVLHCLQIDFVIKNVLLHSS